MATTVAAKDEILEVWLQFKKDQTRRDLRNRLVERYLPLVKFNGERIWSRLPDGVELDDLISAGVFAVFSSAAISPKPVLQQTNGTVRAQIIV